MLTKKRHGAAGVKRGAAFVPFLLSGEAVAVEDPLQGGFHHPAAGVRNQQKPPLHTGPAQEAEGGVGTGQQESFSTIPFSQEGNMQSFHLDFGSRHRLEGNSAPRVSERSGHSPFTHL